MPAVRIVTYDPITGEVQIPDSSPFAFPDDAEVRPVSAQSGFLGTPSHRWRAVHAVAGFRRSLVFGIAPMNAAGVVTNLLLYSGVSAAGLGYVMLRAGYLTGISAILDAPDAADVIVQVFVDGVAVPTSALTIAAGQTSAHLDITTPVAVAEGSVVRAVYSNAANMAPPSLAATLEIED